MTGPAPQPGEPQPGQPCPVCGLPDPEHDWDVHDRWTPPQQRGVGAALPDMLKRSSTRGGHRVRVLALHTTEGILRAADLRAWTAWPGSSHASADATGALLGPADGFVPYHLAAWTLRSGNPWSENIELCGFAKWTRAEWLARPKLLEAAARWLADRSTARGIPLVKLTAAQYAAGGTGVIDHDDHTDGYRDGTHWDVGEQFPWDVVIPRARILAGERPAPEPDPLEAQIMRHVILTNDDGATPDRVALLTIDPVAASAVLPKGQSAAWVQLQCFDPLAPAGTVSARLQWLVATNVNGKHKPYPQRDLRHRDLILNERLPDGTAGVEVRVEGLRRGAAVSVHLDAVGHA